ncbi:MAG: 6-phosphofructokinase, partial [Nitrospiraceae bacterium]
MESTIDQLEFVTVEGLLAYGEMLARRTAGEGVAFPPTPTPSVDRPQRTCEAMERIRAFVQRPQGGFPGAEEYRATRRVLIEEGCRGDELVFFAAWNALLAAGELAPLFRMPIASVQKPTHRRPVAIVPRAQLTPQLVEDRIVLDLGEDRFWLLPRDLTGRTLLFTMRHGVSRMESATYRVGRRLANVLDPERGVPKADAVGAALARMLGVVGQQLDFLHIQNYLDPCVFVHLVSQSPNTRQLYERVTAALMQAQGHPTEALPPACDSALDSQDFGWVTGLEKKVEAEEAAKVFGVDVQTAKRLIKHPFYSYPGGHSFFDVYVDIVDGFRRLGQSHQGKAVCVYSHSSTLRALMIYLDPRPFREAFTEFGEYKEGQDNVVLLTYEQRLLSGYSTAVGLSARERVARETWVKVERERRDRITLKPRQIKRIVALVSGGDFAGAGAALKELRVAGHRFGLEVYFVRHGFLGLANNWIEAVTEDDTRGMGSHASSPIGSSRFEDFKDEQVQQATMRHLRPYMEDGALVVIGGEGSLRGARALYEGFGVQAVGI